jgi:hypothetical protein
MLNVLRYISVIYFLYNFQGNNRELTHIQNSCYWSRGSQNFNCEKYGLLGYNAVWLSNSLASRSVCHLLLLVSYLAYSSTMKMEATCFFETPVEFQWTTRCNIPYDRTLNSLTLYDNLIKL